MLVMSSFIMMPITFGSLPFNILFFIGGVVAKRNHWLEEALPAITFSVKLAAKAIVIVAALAVFGGFLALYLSPRGLGIMKKDACGFNVTPSAGLDDEPLVEIGGLVCGLSLCMGVYCMAVCLVMINVFSENLNYTTKTTVFFAQSAYGAYVLHPFVLTPMTYLYVYIIKEAGPGSAITFQRSFSSTSCVDGDIYLWLGSLWTCVFTLLITFPLAHFARQIPGFDQVL